MPCVEEIHLGPSEGFCSTIKVVAVSEVSNKLNHETIIEPFRFKVVEPIKRTTRAEPDRYLKDAGHSLFLLKAEKVIIGLLTDNGRCLTA